MNVNAAKRLGRELLDEHGLQNWTFKLDNAKVRFGRCNSGKKLITLSFYLTVLNEEAEVRETIMHEIAHALAGHEAGHGPAWKAVARSIGASDSRCYSDDKVVTPPGRWIGTCTSCGREINRHRRPKKLMSCSKCCKTFNPDCLIKWKENV